MVRTGWMQPTITHTDIFNVHYHGGSYPPSCLFHSAYHNIGMCMDCVIWTNCKILLYSILFHDLFPDHNDPVVIGYEKLTVSERYTTETQLDITLGRFFVMALPGACT